MADWRRSRRPVPLVAFLAACELAGLRPPMIFALAAEDVADRGTGGPRPRGSTYPPYPLSQSETAGAVMLVAMKSLWLLALPAAPRGRVATAGRGVGRSLTRRTSDRLHAREAAWLQFAVGPGPRGATWPLAARRPDEMIPWR